MSAQEIHNDPFYRELCRQAQVSRDKMSALNQRYQKLEQDIEILESGGSVPRTPRCSDDEDEEK